MNIRFRRPPPQAPRGGSNWIIILTLLQILYPILKELGIRTWRLIPVIRKRLKTIFVIDTYTPADDLGKKILLFLGAADQFGERERVWLKEDELRRNLYGLVSREYGMEGVASLVIIHAKLKRINPIEQPEKPLQLISRDADEFLMGFLVALGKWREMSEDSFMKIVTMDVSRYIFLLPEHFNELRRKYHERS